MTAFFAVFFSDVKLGDAHLVPVDDRESRKDGQDYVRFTFQLFTSYRNFMIRVKLVIAMSNTADEIFQKLKSS